jgi:very-short-patch-repair endonuclease
MRHVATDAEKKLWRLLRSRQLDAFKFRRQIPVGNYIADFVCHEKKLIIEVAASTRTTQEMPSAIDGSRLPATACSAIGTMMC